MVENFFDPTVADRVATDVPGLRVAVVPVSVDGDETIKSIDDVYENLVRVIEGRVVMVDALRFMAAPTVMCFILAGIHCYLGLHVLARGVIFVDLSLAKVAAFGTTLALLFGFEQGSTPAYSSRSFQPFSRRVCSPWLGSKSNTFRKRRSSASFMPSGRLRSRSLRLPAPAPERLVFEWSRQGDLGFLVLCSLRRRYHVVRQDRRRPSIFSYLIAASPILLLAASPLLKFRFVSSDAKIESP